MQIYTAIFLGGFIGAIGRYGVSRLVENTNTFPFETLLVNLVGCFVLTYFTSHPIWSNKLSRPIQVGIGTGLIGSFTTFSTFSSETLELWMSHQHLQAVLYVVLSLVGGLILSWLGFRVGRIGRNPA